MPGDARLKLLGGWLDLYASDPDFWNGTADLPGDEALTDSQAVAVERIVGTYGDDYLFGRIPWPRVNAGMPDVTEYVRAVESFAALWHLDLLGKRGYEAVHDYCLARFSDGTDPRQFADVARRSALKPALKLESATPTLDLSLTFPLDPSAEPTPTGDVHATSWDVEQDPATGELVAVERPNPDWERLPDWQRRASRAARVGTGPRWNPRTESRGDARARLLRQFTRRLDAELDRIAVEHEQAGFEFRDTKTETGRHLLWTYLEVVKGLTVSEIGRKAAADLNDPRALETTHFENTIREMRAALGLPPRRSSTR